MSKILVLGAGRSSSSLINYLKKNSVSYGWRISIGDASQALAQKKAGNHPNTIAIKFDVNKESLLDESVRNHDIVISMLPPPFHYTVAKVCLKHSKHLLTASYVSPEIAALDKEASSKGCLILMECGLDPGIDHMSALKEIEIIKNKGKLISFKSFTGGLVAPKSDNNPWHYKITWNPRNVVMAGKGVSTYKNKNQIVEVAYEKLFTHTEMFKVGNYGEFEGYPNRDSLKYMDTYGLNDVETFLRGTLRRPGYCSAWNVLVNGGYTDDKNKYTGKLTFKELSTQLLSKVNGSSLDGKLLSLGSEKDLERIKWLGLLKDTPIGLDEFTPADAVQKLLEEKWKLESGDKDMIVMQHLFEYIKEGKKERLISSLVVEGEDELETAMAKTVGLPLGIATKLILTNKINLKGVQIPVVPQLYNPILEELKSLGVVFENKVDEAID